MTLSFDLVPQTSLCARSLGIALVLAALACMSLSVAYAQAYPAKSIRIVVPFPPGGFSDIFGRILGSKFNESWGHPVVIDNRPGAGGRPRAVNRVPACGMRTSASRDARRWI